MYPILFHIGPFVVYAYGFFLALAVVVVTWLITPKVAGIGVEKEKLYDLIFWIVLFAILGARLFFILLNTEYFIKNPLEIFMLHRGGLAWQGSFIGGWIAGIVFLKRHRIAVWKFIDLVIPFVALGHAIGRVGCFLNGCCYGRSSQWGLYFPVLDQKVLPTQLYMIVGQLIIFALLKIFSSKARFDGQIFIWYLILSSLERFIMEFFRWNDYLYFGLSVFQYVCIVLFITGIVLQQKLKKH